MISEVSADRALLSIVRSLQLISVDPTSGLSDEVIAQAARRAIHIMAPCPRHALARALYQSFAVLSSTTDELSKQIDSVIENLVVYGDALEMRSMEGERWEAGNIFMLRPAPPTFVVRKNGWVVILGVAGDQLTPLVGELESRLSHRGVLRVLKTDDGDDILGVLRDIGFLELPEKIWLRVPKIETASAHIEYWSQQLAGEPSSTPIEGLQILDTELSTSFYPKRWTEPKEKHGGEFVARRPQRYGADHWCLVQLEKGILKRFIDMLSPGDRIRPCDIAWRIQAAFDAQSGNPQRYRRTSRENTTTLSFFSPLPSWAERHVSILGDKKKGERCLFSYEFLNGPIETETRFLQDALWLEEIFEQG